MPRDPHTRAPHAPLFGSEAVGISLSGLTKRFDGSATPAVADLDLAISPRGIVTLVGPSGCGKTTTIKMINRLIEPTSGSIEIGGVDITSLPVHELRRHIGYVIQQTGLFPHLTIEANIGTVPRLLGWSKKRTADRVFELVELVGLERDMLGRYPPELSGGQQQRVGVARALAADPPVLLMDEPYSAIDPIVRAHLQDELLDLQSRVGKTIVVVTHDIDEAIKLSDQIAILDVGGVLKQFDTPERLLREPVDDFVADFLGGDRGLKRLALLSVADIEVDAGAVCDVGSTVEAAGRVMEAHGTDWVGLTDGDRLLGWTDRESVAACSSLAELDARAFASVVAPDTSLRVVLDGIVTSETQIAAVVDGERYVGMVSLEQVNAGARR